MPTQKKKQWLWSSRSFPYMARSCTGNPWSQEEWARQNKEARDGREDGPGLLRAKTKTAASDGWEVWKGVHVETSWSFKGDNSTKTIALARLLKKCLQKKKLGAYVLDPKPGWEYNQGCENCYLCIDIELMRKSSFVWHIGTVVYILFCFCFFQCFPFMAKFISFTFSETFTIFNFFSFLGCFYFTFLFKV